MLDEANEAGAMARAPGGTSCRPAAHPAVVLAFTVVGYALEELVDPALRKRRA